MSDTIENIREKIKTKHHGDAKQLDVIFSPAERLLVEAPAGYGKTNTMVSKIAFLIATGKIPNPKRLLALTFSVNAAYKIKKDVTQQLPTLLSEVGFETDPNEKIYVSNYHGFCRSVLKKHGWKIHDALLKADTLKSIDDSRIDETQKTIQSLTFDQAEYLSKFSDAIKNIDSTYLENNFESYCSLVINELLPYQIISYNGILALTIKLFRDFPVIADFYRQYFTTILVDEFQDTNSLSYYLLKELVSNGSRLILLGDSLQRIYGFIGAVPNLLTIAKQDFNLDRIELSKNYRFANNPEMLKLDSAIRRNAENPQAPAITEPSKIILQVSDNQSDEAMSVVKRAKELTEANPTAKVAVLVKGRGANTNRIIEEFHNQNVPFFYGLFTDEQPEYLSFHRNALFTFIELLKERGQISKGLATRHQKMLETDFTGVNETSLSKALLQLLDIFWQKLFSDYAGFSNDDKIALVRDTFEHNGLKQCIEFVDSNVVISTVHGAKGLEWEFVILPDIEQDSLPSWYGMCGNCSYRTNCRLQVNQSNEQKFLEELSVFYVAVTRARKQVYFTASKLGLDVQGRERSKNLSCFLSLKGIEY